MVLHTFKLAGKEYVSDAEGNLLPAPQLVEVPPAPVHPSKLAEAEKPQSIPEVEKIMAEEKPSCSAEDLVTFKEHNGDASKEGAEYVATLHPANSSDPFRKRCQCPACMRVTAAGAF